MWPNYSATEQVRTVFLLAQGMRYLPSCTQVLHKTLNLVISRCCFAEDGKEMNLSRTCKAVVLLIKPFVYWRFLCRRSRVCVPIRMRTAIWFSCRGDFWAVWRLVQEGTRPGGLEPSESPSGTTTVSLCTRKGGGRIQTTTAATATRKSQPTGLTIKKMQYTWVRQNNNLMTRTVNKFFILCFSMHAVPPVLFTG